MAEAIPSLLYAWDIQQQCMVVEKGFSRTCKQPYRRWAGRCVEEQCGVPRKQPRFRFPIGRIAEAKKADCLLSADSLEIAESHDVCNFSRARKTALDMGLEFREPRPWQ
jgi:hypothetical protein